MRATANSAGHRVTFGPPSSPYDPAGRAQTGRTTAQIHSPVGSSSDLADVTRSARWPEGLQELLDCSATVSRAFPRFSAFSRQQLTKPQKSLQAKKAITTRTQDEP